MAFEHIFRAYDIRGIYPTELNEKMAFKIGAAFGTFNPGKIAVGMDARLSGPSLKEAVIKGLILTGSTVIDIGLVTTPMAIFATKRLKCDGGLMVSASHNPKEYNGFRFFDKNAIPISYDLGINEIQKIFEKEAFLKGNGRLLKKDINGDYIDFILKKIGVKRQFGFKLTVDAFNGSGGPVLADVLKRIGIEFHAICCEPDGNFPNHGPDPTKKENILHLREKILETNSDLGIAIDGDGDRFVVVDEKGDVVYPAAVFSFFIKNMLREDPKAKIIYEVLSSGLVDDSIKKWGGIPLVCRVGNTYITKKMVNEGALMGGEASGHYYFKDVFGADDAIFATLKFIQFFQESGMKLSDFVKQLPKYFYEEMRISTAESEKVPFIEALKKDLKTRGHEIDETDGVKVLFKNGWALLRPSNTEPKISIAYEANNQKDFGKIKNFVGCIIKRIPEGGC